MRHLPALLAAEEPHAARVERDVEIRELRYCAEALKATTQPLLSGDQSCESKGAAVC